MDLLLALETNACAPVQPGTAGTRGDAAEAVEALLSLPDAQLDYARAKLTLDAIVDPATDVDAVLAELDGMTDRAWQLAGPSAANDRKLAALRTLIYEAGPWNDHRPFAYDHDRYRKLSSKFLSNYLATRLGNCVSMPILFLILADRLGLDIALSKAPAHLFLRHREEDGRIVNLETTSGAMPARDVWIRQSRGVTDRAVASGFHMRSLSRREGAAAMALTVVEHLTNQTLYAEAITVTEVLLRHNPRDGMAWANQGNACFKICRTEFLDRYGSHFLIPLPLRARYLSLLGRNRAAFATAHALGWEPVG